MAARRNLNDKALELQQLKSLLEQSAGNEQKDEQIEAIGDLVELYEELESKLVWEERELHNILKT